MLSTLWQERSYGVFRATISPWSHILKKTLLHIKSWAIYLNLDVSPWDSSCLDLSDTRRRNIHRPTSVNVSGGSPSRILMEKSFTSDLKFKMTTLCWGTQRKIRLSIKCKKIIHIGNDREIYVVRPFCLRSQEKEPQLFNLSLSLSLSLLPYSFRLHPYRKGLQLH